MTNVIHQESFTIAPLAPLSEAPASSGGAGPGLGARISNDWGASKRDGEAKVRHERRSAIERARHSVEAGWSRPGQITKQERLAASKSSGRRDTGGLAERRATLGSVAKAMAAVENVPSDTEFSEPEFRRIREILRQRYPGASLSSMLAEGHRMEAMLLDDPANAYQVLLAAYSRAKPAPGYVEPAYSTGTRGSLQRAKQDQQDSEDLKDWIARFGKRLPAIMAELEYVDRALHSNTNYQAAKLAARHGAPAVESEIAPYEQKQAAKTRQRSMENIVHQAIAAGLISGDESVLNDIGDVLLHSDFPWARHVAEGGENFRYHALAHAQHVAMAMRDKKPARAGSDAGSRSIGGGSPASGHGSPRGPRMPGTGGIRDSINRAMGA
jgi:hypothetical protein